MVLITRFEFAASRSLKPAAPWATEWMLDVLCSAIYSSFMSESLLEAFYLDERNRARQPQNGDFGGTVAGWWQKVIRHPV